MSSERVVVFACVAFLSALACASDVRLSPLAKGGECVESEVSMKARARDDDELFRIRQRAFKWVSHAQAACDYEEERKWIAERRAELERPANGPLWGLALSGGGIRAATVSLGVLQALQKAEVLRRLDYVSAVSGGGYLASWVQTHFGAGNVGAERDELGYELVAKTPEELLADGGDHVEHLRHHAGFLNRGGWWEGPKFVGSYLWRWPFALTLDIGLHLKTPINNKFHPIDIYRQRLGLAYHRGELADGDPIREVLLSQMNAYRKRSPYFVLNGHLTNWGNPRSGASKPRGEPYNFEFTAHYTGSDGIGYVQTPGFDRPVREVLTDGMGVPVAVKVRTGGRPFHLPWATAAAGAAFDPDGFITKLDSRLLRGVVAFVAAPLNLNLGYEAPNFARRFDGPLESIIDYARMITIQRFPPLVRTDARYIEVTDGGHYENLGIAALARRGVDCILAVDAGADGDYKYGDLRALKDRLKTHDLTMVGGIPAKPVPSFEFSIHHNGEQVSQVFYVKSNADEGSAHMPADGGADVDKIRSYHDYDREDDRERLLKMLHLWKPFPHTSTIRQWFNWETFEAYRLLGYQLGKTYLAKAASGRCRL